MTESELNEFETSILSVKGPAIEDPRLRAWAKQADRMLLGQYKELFRLARLGIRLELGKSSCRHYYKGQHTTEGQIEMVCDKCGAKA